MDQLSADIEATPDDAKPFRVVVKSGAVVIHSKPVDSRAEGVAILLRISAGSREPSRAAAASSKPG